MKIKLSLLLILLCILTKLSFGQEDQDEKDQPISIFLNASGLVHPKLPGPIIGVEYRWNPNFGIHQQLGYVHANYEETKFNSLNTRKRRGFRTSSELRWYRDGFEPFDKTIYWGMHFRYWKYSENGKDRFCRENCQFQQFLEYELRQYAVGMGLSRGAIQHLGKHIYMDYGGSLGFIYRNNQTNLPSDATPLEERFGFNNPNPTNFEKIEMTFLFYIKFGCSF